MRRLDEVSSLRFALLGMRPMGSNKGALAGGSAPCTPQKVDCLPAASRALGGPGALGPWALEAAGRQPTFLGVAAVSGTPARTFAD